MSARRVLLVTGLSGAGKSTALRTLEDGGWETVDNLPQSLLGRLIDAPAGDGPRGLAIGMDARTRGFDPQAMLAAVARLGGAAEMLFLDCAGAELVRRYAETRRRHPLAPDRPAEDGIARERTLTVPLRAAADHLIDTTDFSAHALQAAIRDRFCDPARTTLTVMSFGYKRGLPRDADLVLDMRFLRNPYWEPALRPLTGHDPAVAAYVAADPAFEEAVERIDGLLALLLPRYAAEGKSYVAVAIGCTGGRHRSVHSAETIAARLRARGFSPTIVHRDLGPAGGGAMGVGVMADTGQAG